jgi:hypothetical protein
MDPVETTATATADATVDEALGTTPAAGDGQAERAAEADWFQKAGIEHDETPPQDDQEEAAPAADAEAGQEQGTPETAPKAETPIPLTDMEKQLLKRMQLADDDVLDVIEGLGPTKREKFITHLEKTQTELNRRFSGRTPDGEGTETQTQQPGQSQPGQQQAPPAATPPANPQLDDHWKKLEGGWGDDLVTPLRSATHATIEAHVKPIAQTATQLMAYFVDQQAKQVLDGLQLPEGVDGNDPAVRQRIQQAMVEDLRGRFVLGQNDFTHSAPRVISTLYPQQIAATQRTRTNQQRSSALRGTPDAGQRRPSAQPRVTEEQREELAMQGITKGLSGKQLEDYVRSGGSR